MRELREGWSFSFVKRKEKCFNPSAGRARSTGSDGDNSGPSKIGKRETETDRRDGGETQNKA